jgi:hypothetical protein
MKAAAPWITYRTRFLVKARQLSSSLSFTDVLGRQHSGSKGDYLVESSDGVMRIAPRQIFEDVYVPLLENDTREKTETPRKPDAWDRHEMLSQQEPSSQCKIPTPLPLAPHLISKSPQPSHDRRYSGFRSL